MHPTGAFSHKQLAELRQKIDQHFDEEELRTLCFDLGVNYGSLPAQGMAGKARELVDFLNRRNRIPELVEACVKRCPEILWLDRHARLFISYKGNDSRGTKLAQFLNGYLAKPGHRVFLDTETCTEGDWYTKIDSEIKSSDYMVVLLSSEPADGDVVQAEISRAYDHAKRQGHPAILPVRVAHDGLLPLSIQEYVNPRQYVQWKTEADSERVGVEILAAVQLASLPEHLPIKVSPLAAERASEDGTEITDFQSISSPRAKFDHRRLNLEDPTQVVKLRDKFYVPREADHRLEEQTARSSSITTLHAPRQTGKSSLLVRGIQRAVKKKARVVLFDLQLVESAHLRSLDLFLCSLAEFIVHRLKLDLDQVEKIWGQTLTPIFKLTCLMEDYILPTSDNRLVLAMDDVDRLLTTSFYNDFFSMVRAWCNRAAQEPWDKLSIVMTVATEPWLFLQEIHPPPFNVGTQLRLEDFNELQVRYLNEQHGSPVGEEDLRRLMGLLNGHPYLTRQALYTLVHKKLTWGELDAIADGDHSPFSDHLKSYYWLLREHPNQLKALKQIMNQNRCRDEDTFYRLEQAGLVKGTTTACQCRCGLYQRYFADKLR